MGILLLNIIDFAMPAGAYVDPHVYGGATGANHAVWEAVYILADGKMRGLFTMMFGASTVLVAQAAFDRGDSPERVHYSRMAALFIIGLAHAYLIWWGDILVLYAVTGAVAFVAWQWRARLLVAVGIALLLFKLTTGLIDYASARQLQVAAAAADASPAVRVQWRAYAAEIMPPPGQAGRELRIWRSGYAGSLPARAKQAWFAQTVALVQNFGDTLALMLIGMALFRSGFFSGDWPRRRYWTLAIACYAICIPLYLPLVGWIDATRFSPITLIATEAIQLSLLRPWLSLAHAAIVILLVRSGAFPALAARLGAVGQMAFSNYLGTSILCTLLFNGYGLGWFGYLQRWQCYGVVVAIWVLMLLWSQPWLARFRFGPFEWLWRSLARGKLQPMRGAAA